METSLCAREEKWHMELGYALSNEFWRSTYKLTSEINNDNKIKWLQYQLNRNSLYTNIKVHKFNQQVAPTCTFCLQNDPRTTNLESVSHLFADCDMVRGLWTGVRCWLDSLDLKLPESKTTILFGHHEQPITSVINHIILTVKFYIWFSRLQNQILNLNAFKKYLYTKLKELKNVYIYEKKEYKFDQWAVVFDSMS